MVKCSANGQLFNRRIACGNPVGSLGETLYTYRTAGVRLQLRIVLNTGIDSADLNEGGMNMAYRTTSRAIATGLVLLSWLPAMVAAHEMSDYTGQVFPPEHALNTRIDSLPVHPNSDNFITSIGANTALHPDFGTAWDDGGTLRQMGIPCNVVGADQPKVPITWTLYGNESDPGPWPIPQNPSIETVFDWRETDDGDRHMLIIDSSARILYETGNVYGNEDGTEWDGGCGAVFDLASCALRTDEWTSADAAGLPIFPLLIRYDEVERALEGGGELPHAIRFTVQRSQRAYIWPARHYASSSTDQNRPPMGLRFRLKADYNVSGYSLRMQVVLRTFKKYGIIVADNGSSWYFQGTHDDRWDDEEISTLKRLRGSDFEAVDISEWFDRPGFDTNSAAVPPPSGAKTVSGHRHYMPHGLTLVSVRRKGARAPLMVTYSAPGGAMVRLGISDLTGKTIYATSVRSGTQGTNTVMIDNSFITSGISIIRLYSAHHGIVSKPFTIFR
jgi:hypothetical protein